MGKLKLPLWVSVSLLVACFVIMVLVDYLRRKGYLPTYTLDVQNEKELHAQTKLLREIRDILKNKGGRSMIYAEGILYPHDANGVEFERAVGWHALENINVKQYYKEMHGMPMYVGVFPVGKALDVYFDAQGNLCVFFELHQRISSQLTHLMFGYTVALEHGRAARASKFQCVLSTWRDALFKSCTFKVLPVQRCKRHYFKHNLLLYS